MLFSPSLESSANGFRARKNSMDAKLDRQRFFPFVLLLGWCVIIFWFSSQPGNGQATIPPLWYILERKSAHVFEYAVLVLLAFRYFHSTFWKESYRKQLFLSASFALMYGALDELHQFFVFGRGAQLSDVAIDGLGIMLMISFLLLIFRFRR